MSRNNGIIFKGSKTSGAIASQKLQEHAINAANEFTSAEYIILEQDQTRMPTQLDSITKSMESFHQFSNISWDN